MNWHRAIVRWLSPIDRGKKTLPPTLRYIGIGRFSSDGPEWPDGAWSVECRFEVPPPEQSDPGASAAEVRFLVASAPHERMVAGQAFQLYEGPVLVATVDVVD